MTHATYHPTDYSSALTRAQFNAKINELAAAYLARTQYYDLLHRHRNPQEVRSHILQQLNKDMLSFQYRQEARDIDPRSGAAGYVNVVVGDIWRSDKRIRDLYDAIEVYVVDRRLDFDTVALLIAEYRAMDRLYRRINRTTHKPAISTLKAPNTINIPSMSASTTPHTTNPAPLTVLLSYSWDDDPHKQWVLRLADKLQTDAGIYVLLDQYDLRAGKNMTHFMEQGVAKADKVVLILTPAYKKKVDDRTGGAGYEGSMISQGIYDDQHSGKFIPVVRKGHFKDASPHFVKPILSHTMTADATFEKDFDTLVRLLYDQPEVTRPPLGKRPDFATVPKYLGTATATALINDTENISKCGRPNVAHWTFAFELISLADETKLSLYKLIRAHLLKAKDGAYCFPFILNDRQKTGNIDFTIPLKTMGVVNHLSEEKLEVEESFLRYEFAEYNDGEFMLLMTMQPFTTLVYLLAIFRAVHEQLNREVDMSIRVEIVTNKRAMLYSKHSPFNMSYIYNIQNMALPGNKGALRFHLKDLSNGSQFKLFQRIYELFTSEDSRSAHPSVELDRSNFEVVLQELLG